MPPPAEQLRGHRPVADDLGGHDVPVRRPLIGSRDALCRRDARRHHARRRPRRASGVVDIAIWRSSSCGRRRAAARDPGSINVRQVTRGVRRLRHLRAPRGGQPRLPRALRAAAPRAGERRHRHRGRRAAPRASRDGLRRRRLRRDDARPRCRATRPSATCATPPPATASCRTRSRLLIDCAHGQIAVCHNGNLVNAGELRHDLVRAGLHLPDHERHRGGAAPVRPVAGPTGRAGGRRVAGAGDRRLLAPAADARPPDRGARPARVPPARARAASATRYIVCSETCAMDLIGAHVRARRRAGRDPRDLRARAAQLSRRSRRSRWRTACSSTCTSRGPTASCSDAASTRPGRPSAGSSRARSAWPPTSSCPCPTPACARRSGYAEEAGMPFRMGLIRNHYVGRTFIEPQQSIRHFGVRVKLNPVREHPGGPAGRAHRRLDRPRHDEPQDRQDGARRRRARSPRAHQLPADHLPVLLRRRHAAAARELIAATHSLDEVRRYLGADTLAYLSLEGLLAGVGDLAAVPTARRATPAHYPVAFPRDRESTCSSRSSSSNRTARQRRAQPTQCRTRLGTVARRRPRSARGARCEPKAPA